MPMMRTPSISLGKSRRGTPEAVGTQRLMIDDHVIFLGIGKFEDSLANVFEKLARHQSFGIEGHISDRAAGPVKMRGKSQAIDAAGRAGEYRRRAAHAKTHAQGAEGGAHALWLVMRTRWIVFCVLPKRLAQSCRLRCSEHLVLACVTAKTIDACRLGIDFARGFYLQSVGHVIRREMVHCSAFGFTRRRTRLPARVSRSTTRRTCPLSSRVRARHCGRPTRR